jgi:hypothetical protein
MKTTLEKVVQIRGVLASLFNHDTKNPIKVSAKIRYDLVRNHRLARQAAKDFDETRTALIQNLGEENKDGEHQITPASPNFATFKEQMKELAAREVEVDLRPITIDLAVADAMPMEFVAALLELGVATEAP